MADEESNTGVFVYTEGAVVPEDVVHVRVHPSVTVIPERAFEHRKKLEEIELCDGLLEIGQHAFECTALKRLSIPPTVTVIHQYAFSECRQLKEIELRDGLQEIHEYAFLYVGLKRLTIPNTVRSIGSLAFCHAYQLRHLQLPEGIESIGVYAFSHNRCATCRIPPGLTRLTNSFLGSNCQSMFSIELPEGITIVEHSALQEYHSLRNIAFPPIARVEEIDDEVFDQCTDLQQLYETDQQLVNVLKHRFDNLPIHKMIYYQSYNNVTVEQLNEALDMRSGQRRSSRMKLDQTGRQQDCLGMTPLHIMACSTVQNIELCRVLIEKYPENLVTEDRWGAIPLLYAVWGDAPKEIVQFLVEGYKTIHPKYEFDWNKMVEQLCLGNAATSSIQMLMDVQQEISDQLIDWHAIIRKALINETPVVQADVFSFLVKGSFSKRINAIGIKQWRDDLKIEIEKHVLIENGVLLNSSDLPERQRWLDGFNSKLSRYEAEYRNLKEVTSMLELVVWKKKMNDHCEERNEKRRVKKMKIEEAELRKQCRVNCGANIIIVHVLPFLTG